MKCQYLLITVLYKELHAIILDFWQTPIQGRLRVRICQNMVHSVHNHEMIHQQTIQCMILRTFKTKWLYYIDVRANDTIRLSNTLRLNKIADIFHTMFFGTFPSIDLFVL